MLRIRGFKGRVGFAPLLGMFATLLTIVPGCHDAHGMRLVDEHRKDALLASMRRGMTRAEFYESARRLDVVPGSPDYVKPNPNGGVPLDNGDFPMPNATHLHPSVSVFMLLKRVGGCAIPTDEVDVFFDQHDRVARWSSRSFTTGGCP